ncbi:MAG TPA: C4-dicarboxylate ABC transporter, partial [Burkholderiaceae bacterium]|nr:C4-dicarboxylate ABC transporter [Burkholderiaceae bacterium]
MKRDENVDSVPKKQMRRRFLASSAAAGATTLGFPMIARAQTPITLRFQSTWPLKFIYHECAVDWCKKAA